MEIDVLEAMLRGHAPCSWVFDPMLDVFRCPHMWFTRLTVEAAPSMATLGEAHEWEKQQIERLAAATG